MHVKLYVVPPVLSVVVPGLPFTSLIAFVIVSYIDFCILSTTLLLQLLLLLSLCVFVDKKIVHNNIYYDNEWSEDNL